MWVWIQNVQAHQVFQMHGLINKSQTVKINPLNAFDNTLYSKKKLFFWYFLIAYSDLKSHKL